MVIFNSDLLFIYIHDQTLTAPFVSRNTPGEYKAIQESSGEHGILQQRPNLNLSDPHLPILVGSAAAIWYLHPQKRFLGLKMRLQYTQGVNYILISKGVDEGQSVVNGGASLSM